jgi:F-type H+-transporting ATPase subunit b
LLASIALALAEGGGNIINPDLSLLIVLALFIIFVFILRAILFKPIGRVLDERQALTEGAMHEARASSRRYQNRLAEYEATIRQARGESYRRLEQERAAALDRRRQLIEQAKQQAAEEIDRARADINQQALRAQAILESEARQIAQQISRTLLGRTVGGGAD